MRFQIAAVGLEAGNQQVCLCLLCSSAELLWNVSAANKNVCLDAHLALQVRHMLGGIANEFLFPHWIDVIAARPPRLHAGRDVRKREPGPEFLSELLGPRNGLAVMRV